MHSNRLPRAVSRVDRAVLLNYFVDVRLICLYCSERFQCCLATFKSTSEGKPRHQTPSPHHSHCHNTRVIRKLLWAERCREGHDVWPVKLPDETFLISKDNEKTPAHLTKLINISAVSRSVFLFYSSCAFVRRIFTCAKTFSSTKTRERLN